jgi:uncharacterized protein YcbK (DUF882 family)
MLLRRVIPIACGAALLASVATPSIAIAQSHHHHASRAHHHAHVNLSEYRANVRRWHDPSDAAPIARTADGYLVLRLYSLNTHARAEIAPGAGEGPARFDTAACAQVATDLMDSRTQTAHPIDPLLVDMLYRVADHFGAPEVRIVSGYRAGSGHSNHALGRAVDFIVPGASDRAVADYAQSLGDVGVGFYPVSGFVHLDVRDRPTTWVDSSGPGARARYVHGGRHRHGHHHHGPTARR